ncbi:hypothetical protein JX266_004168 [Neoarthrinium moseri]|nr:hypothetical protein JX266_004168 [Neoarthrinium moseri]
MASFHDTFAADYPRQGALTKEQLQRLYVKNKFELTKHVSAVVGAKAQYFGGNEWFISWYSAPEGAEIHNGLEHQDVPDQHVPAALDAVKHNLKDRRFNWVTGPQDQNRLEYHLRRQDFTVDEQEPVMVVDLRQQTEAMRAAVPNGIRIGDIDSWRVRDWVKAWSGHAPVEATTHWTQIYDTMLNTLHRKQFCMFMAQQGGRVIGTGYLHCFAGIASIHAIAVVPELRGNGIGKALTAYGMQRAASIGYNISTLTSSRAGLNVFQSLGFKEFGVVKLNVWRPLIDRGTIENEQKEALEAEQDGWCLV